MNSVQAMPCCTHGSLLQREQIAAQLREFLMGVPIVPQPAMAALPMAAQIGTTDTHQFLSLKPRRFARFGDLQSLEEFIDRLDSCCPLNGVKPEDRLTHIVPATLEGSAKLWFRFAGGFNDWPALIVAFQAEFVPIDLTKRLTVELCRRTQHPEENLNQFIYMIVAYCERFWKEATNAEKVNRVLPQMHPQFQDMVQGKTFVNLEELVQVADEPMERVWRHLEYVPPPQPSIQMVRDLAFQSMSTIAASQAVLPVAYSAALATLKLAASSGPLWAMHPAALQPFFYRDQLAASTVPLPQLMATRRHQLSADSHSRTKRFPGAVPLLRWNETDGTSVPHWQATGFSTLF